MDVATTPLLSDALLDSLSRRGDLRPYARGEVLIREGELSDALYILVSGQVKVYTQDARKRELVYNVLEPGEYFGELFLDGGPRSASAKAATDVQCIVVGPAEFRAFMLEYPEFAESLVVKLIARVRHATAQIRSLGLDGVHERVVQLIERLAVPGADGRRVLPKEYTQQELADRIGASREMVNHVMRELTHTGYLERGEDRSFILAAEAAGQG